MSKYIYGLHDPGGEYLMRDSGTPGWIVFTHALGHDPDDTSGFDYGQWSEFGVIARLNNGYNPDGTIPKPEHYEDFAKRVANFVGNSQGCHIWIVGNEPNMVIERPDGQPILPSQYALCYSLCREAIRNLVDHEDDQVCIAAIAPWNNQTAYWENESGDWIKYFQDVLRDILTLGHYVDAITIHTYTHGPEPSLIASEAKMDSPFEHRRFQFRTYRDFLNAVPLELRDLPVYITETNQNDAWDNCNSGWVREAYREIDEWNRTPGTQKIRCLCLYRWPPFDKYFIEGKTGVYADFRAAMEYGYKWTNDDDDDDGGDDMPSSNRLKNPNMEEEYTERGAGEVKVTRYWEPFFATGLPPQEHSQGPCVRPEYKPATLGVDPLRVYEGNMAQCLFATYAVMDAGLYQRIEGLPIDVPFDFSVHAQAWCDNGDDPRVSRGEMYLSLGIDLDGGVDPWSLSVNWIQWVPLTAEYREIDIGGLTMGPTVTVFVRCWNKWKSKHADVYLDATTFVIEEKPEPEPPPGEGFSEEDIREFAKDEARKLFLKALS